MGNPTHPIILLCPSLIGWGGPSWGHFDLLGELTGLFGRFEYLVVEDREVECESESARVGGAEDAFAYLQCLLVCLCTVSNHHYTTTTETRVISHNSELWKYWGESGCGWITTVAMASGDLGEVSVVVSLHVQVKHLWLFARCLRDQKLFQQTLWKKRELSRVICRPVGVGDYINHFCGPSQ